MSSSVPPPLLSPGVGARRKILSQLPKLPLSAFTPPNSSTSGSFPLPPSPSSLQPSKIVDTHVVAPAGDYSRWTQEASTALDGKATGVVLSLYGTDPALLETLVPALRAGQNATPILAILVPFSLEDGAPTELPAYLRDAFSPGPRVVLSAVYTKFSMPAVDALRWAVEKGFTIDLAIETNLRAGEGAWEDLEELLTKSGSAKANIVLSNILPPPDDLSLPIVVLLTHSTYQHFQAQTAALSLYSGVSIKFIPPSWKADTVDKREWKRRMKMYIGPVLEAFGPERVLWGSSPLPSSPATLSLTEWYSLAWESWAEFGLETDAIQSIFHGTAERVYGPSQRQS